MRKTIITSAIVSAIVAILVGWLLFGGTKSIFGDASVENYPVIFAQGLRAGFKTVVTAIDNKGAWVSNVSSSQGAILTGIVNNGTSTFGGSTINNQLNLFVTATSTAQNGTTTAIVLGPVGSTTSTTSTVIGLTSGIAATGLAVGDPCIVTTNVTNTAAMIIPACTITSVATTTASSTVTYQNGSSTAYTMPTSTVIRIEAHHLGF